MPDAFFSQEVTLRSGKKVTLRYPQLSDTPALLRFVNELVAEDTYILVNQPQTLEQEQKYVEGLIKARAENNEVCICAFVGDRCVANTTIHRQAYRADHVGLLSMSVAQDYRSEGLGSLLIDLLLEQARTILDLKLVTLECLANNTVAFNLYQKKGFVEFGRLPGGIIYQNQPVDTVYLFQNL